jgi:hypothetical protein
MLMAGVLAGCNEKPQTVSTRQPPATELVTTSWVTLSSTTTSSPTTSTTVARVTTTVRAVLAPVATSPPVTATGCPNGTYVNTAGNTVCRPAASESAPPGATAQCRDGDYSYSQSRSGTCSGHGGVAHWL